MSKPWSPLVILGMIGLITMASAMDVAAEEPSIPEKKLVKLEQQLFEALKDTKSSSLRKRRAFKNLVRDGESLIKVHPNAPNRFQALEVILKCQIKLMGLQKTDRNREAIFETSEKISKAPDEYAEIRFRAELLLSEKELSEKDSSYEDHAKALSDLLDRYQGSSAEARILMKGVTVAASLNAYELKDRLLDRLDDEFMHDEEVIEFRRQIRSTNLRASFQNKFIRIDGSELSFPQDTGGKLCVFAFWSMENPSIDDVLGYLKNLQVKFPEALQVFSLNLDNLPDGGKSKLDQLGVNWQILSIPKGRKSKAYTTYARSDPTFVLVDPYGFTLLKPRTGSKGSVPRKANDPFVLPPHLKIDESLLTLGRFLNQLQSVNIGDFLVQGSPDIFSPSQPPELLVNSPNLLTQKDLPSSPIIESDIPDSLFQELQECFSRPPFRYRVSPSQASENYRKAEALTKEAIKKYSSDPGVWILRNRRIVALMGMWQTDLQPKYLKLAAQEARASLSTKLIKGAEVIPYFCLAKESLRFGNGKPKDILEKFIEDTGGKDAPPSAIAAASTLALFNIRKEELQTTYREAALTEKTANNSLLWPLRAFLTDRCNHYFFSGLSNGHWRNARWHLINHQVEPLMTAFPEVTLWDLDKKPLVLPKDNSNAQTLLLFIEPPQGSAENFPVMEDEKGNISRADYIRSAMGLAQRLHDQKDTKDINVIAAFLSDDPNRVRHLMKTNNWTFKAAMLPNGLANPMVPRLNILSADRLPNAYLIRRNGTVSWNMSGLKYGERDNIFAVELALRAHFERNEVTWGYQALKLGNPQEAKRAFLGPFPKNLINRYAWRGPRKHGLTLANIALKDWSAALESVDDAIFEHMARHSHGIPRPRRASLEQKSQFGEKVLKEKPHEIISELWRLKTLILEKLGREEDATPYRELLKKPSAPDTENAYNRLHYKFIELASKQKL